MHTAQALLRALLSDALVGAGEHAGDPQRRTPLPARTFGPVADAI
jgi:hypothetical protein